MSAGEWQTVQLLVTFQVPADLSRDAIDAIVGNALVQIDEPVTGWDVDGNEQTTVSRIVITETEVTS